MIAMNHILQNGQKVPVIIYRHAARGEQVCARTPHLPEGNILLEVDGQVEIGPDRSGEHGKNSIALRDVDPSKVLRLRFRGAAYAAKHEYDCRMSRKMRRPKDNVRAAVTIVNEW